MSNRLAKDTGSRDEVLNRVSNEAISKVRSMVFKAGLSEFEALTVLASLSKGLQDATKEGLRKYADDNPS